MIFSPSPVVSWRNKTSTLFTLMNLWKDNLFEGFQCLSRSMEKWSWFHTFRVCLSKNPIQFPFFFQMKSPSLLFPAPGTLNATYIPKIHLYPVHPYSRAQMVSCSKVGFVGNCATLEVILIVRVLYFLVLPTRYYIDVITHVNPRKNQCKPWGNIT